MSGLQADVGYSGEWVCLALVCSVPLPLRVVCADGLVVGSVGGVGGVCWACLAGGAVAVCGVSSLGTLVLLGMCLLRSVCHGWRMQMWDRVPVCLVVQMLSEARRFVGVAC